MIRIKDTTFDFDKEHRITYCYIVDNKNRMTIGTAMCHEDDVDMMSWRTGEEIAFRRAKMDALRTHRDVDLLPRLSALKQLYYSMKHSSKFNPKSYENIMLQRQIRAIEFDLSTIKEILAYEHQNLKEYIQGKDKIYKRIRERNKGQE